MDGAQAVSAARQTALAGIVVGMTGTPDAPRPGRRLIALTSVETGCDQRRAATQATGRGFASSAQLP